MDEVIFEEFKGTGNMELQLDRRISNRRIYPGLIQSPHLLEEKIFLLQKEWNQEFGLRNYLADMNPVEAMEFMKDRITKTKDNEEFLLTMNG